MVCFFNLEKYWGGGEKWHFKMAQLFMREGIPAVICVSPGSELEERAKEHNIPTKSFNLRKNSFLNPFKVREVAKFFKQSNVDTVIMNNPNDLKIGTFAANKAKVKNIIYRRGMPHPIRNTMLNRWLFSKLTNVIAISEEIKRSILVNNPNIIDNDKIVLFYNSIDPADYNPVKKEIGKKIVFGTTGRLVEQKGQHHLVVAAENLKEKGYDFEILIAGKGPLEDELKLFIEEKELGDYVKLIGFIKDLNPFLNSIDVFVFPSYFEGSAVSIVEAIYFGKPVIAFDVSTMPELVKDGYNGFLAEFKDSYNFADCMEKFLADHSLIEKMGENAIAMRDQYNLLNVYERLKKLIGK